MTNLPLPQFSTSPSAESLSNAQTSRPSTATYPPPVEVKFRRRTRTVMSCFNDIVVLVWIGLRVFPVAILIILGLAALMGLFFALVASTGAISMLTGNGILRAAHLAHYTNNASAALIGVVGSLISVFILALLSPCIPKTHDKEGNKKVPWYIQICTYPLFSTLSGTIGSAILLHGHVDLGGIDILHATRAGALGGAILGPGSILIAPFFAAVLLLILPPIWIAISMGARWVTVRSSEDWMERSRSYPSNCYCCGARGDDPEMNAELANGTKS